MIRFLILAGYFELTMYLQISGKLDQYINTHYAYLAYISMVLSFLLAVIQLVIWMKNLKLHSHLHGKIAKLTSPMILVIPVLVGLLVPTVTLDSTTVAAKGYNFPLAAGSAGTVSDDGTTVQYLKPDTSLYFTSSAYEKEMQKEALNYIRLMSHLYYMVVRTKTGEAVNIDLNEFVQEKYPEAMKIAALICDNMAEKLERQIMQEEVGFLAIHIQRMVAA
mgnify:CR=1 FL=1